MAIKSIKEKEKPNKIEIDLTGPDGNAFVLIGIAQKLAKQLDYQPDSRGELTAEMMSGDYENLLKVMEMHFGEYIIMWR